MPPPPFLTPNSRLAGYQIVELVGRGGMGEVYRAKQLSMEREVALKILSPRLAKQDPSFAGQFVAEARAAGVLNHPNIVAVHDVGNAPAPEGCNDLAVGEVVHFFSMEFITGETVKDVIERQGAVDIDTVALVMRGMTEALSYAEANRIVHRDVKPDNIMLPANGGVKLADLGLAQQVGTEEAVAERDASGRAKVVGTPLYMAPEQAQAKPVDHRADQYALGATLFHMLTGRPPYQGDNARAIMRAHCFSPVPDPAEVNPQTPAPWRTICMRLMAKVPDDRYPTAAELRSAVKEASRWRPSDPVGPGLRPSRSIVPLLATAAGAVALAGAAAWFALVWLPGRPKPPAPQPPASQATPVQHPDPGPAKDPATQTRERITTAIQTLPTDLAMALTVVEGLLADPASAPMRDQLLAKRTALKQALEERHRNGLREHLDQAERAIESGQLRTAHVSLDHVPVDEEWPRGRRQVLLDRLTAAERTVEQRLETLIADAKDKPAGDKTLALIDGAELLDPVRALLRQHLEQHLTALAQAPPPPPPPAPTAPVPDPGAWRSVGERIERVRGAMPYSAFADTCAEAARDLPAADRDLLLPLAGVAKLAERVETALRLYLPSALPKVEARFGARNGTFVITRLEKDLVGFKLADIPAESSERRATATLPWLALASAALKDKPDPQALAAFLWYWRQPEAGGLIAKLGDIPLARAVAAYDLRTRPIDVPGVVSKHDDLLRIDYPFATSHDKDLLAAWDGGGATIGERGLTWKSDRLTNSYEEAGLPTLAWTASLKPPMTLDAELQCDASTHVAMLGLRSGARVVRISLRHDKRLAFATITAEDGHSYENVQQGYTSYNGLEPVRLHLGLAVDGHIDATVNEQPLSCKKPLTLPAGAPASVVLQARQPKEPASLVIRSLSITGKP